MRELASGPCTCEEGADASGICLACYEAGCGGAPSVMPCLRRGQAHGHALYWWQAIATLQRERDEARERYALAMKGLEREMSRSMKAEAERDDERDTLRSALASAEERVRRLAKYARHGAEALLDAPCIDCGYNGPGYWQAGTHAETCRWRNVGGEAERIAALTEKEKANG